MMSKCLEIAKTFRPYDGTSGTYVSVMPSDESSKVLQHWIRAFRLTSLTKPASDLHCTVVWSKTPVGRVEGLCDATLQLTSELDHFEWWAGHDNDGYLTAVLKSSDLTARSRLWSQRGAVHSFDPYLPHVTLASKLALTKDLEDRILYMSRLYTGFPLVFNGEQIENAK